MGRTHPGMAGFAVIALTVWSRSEWRIEAVKVPGTRAEIAPNNLANGKSTFAHRRVSTTKTEDGIVLAVTELQVVRILLVPSSM